MDHRRNSRMPGNDALMSGSVVAPHVSRHFKSRYIALFELVYYSLMFAFRFFMISFDFFFPLLCYDVIFISPLLFLRFFILYIYSVLVMAEYQIIEVLPSSSVVV